MHLVTFDARPLGLPQHHIESRKSLGKFATIGFVVMRFELQSADTSAAQTRGIQKGMVTYGELPMPCLDSRHRLPAGHGPTADHGPPPGPVGPRLSSPRAAGFSPSAAASPRRRPGPAVAACLACRSAAAATRHSTHDPDARPDGPGGTALPGPQHESTAGRAPRRRLWHRQDTASTRPALQGSREQRAVRVCGPSASGLCD
jgi:hypothetical protein